jgi:hypothetical protein
MALENDLVDDLLTYIEQVEKLKIKPPFSVPTEYFAAFQHELRGLPEIRFNVQSEGEDIWLCIPRLREIPAPEPEEKLSPWITLHKTPAKLPELKPAIEVPDTQNGPEQAKTRAEIRELFDWYVENLWTPWAATELPRAKQSSVTTRYLRSSRQSQKRVPTRRWNWFGVLGWRFGRGKAGRLLLNIR